MKSLKILFIGNSFAVDTMEHTPQIARALGFEQVKFVTLYVGGCSIDRHYQHAVEEIPAYEFCVNTGDGWEIKEHCRISDAIRSDDWDWIAIQHGTGDGSRYTSAESYEKLSPLIAYVKALCPARTRIAFNLTWLGESTHQHPEILSYEGNMVAMRKRLEEVTREVLAKNPNIDLLVPTGTAIENARTSKIGLLTRDCYHLSMDKGRYIAGLTFISSVTGLSVKDIAWMPKGVDDYARRVAIESVCNAQKAPFEVTSSEIVE